MAEGHGDEHAAVLAFSDLVDGADVGVVEDRGGLGLVDEALAGLGVVRELGREELERDGAAELEIVGLVDDAHSAPADLAEDAVLAGDNRPGGKAAGERLDGRSERGGIDGGSRGGSGGWGGGWGGSRAQGAGAGWRGLCGGGGGSGAGCGGARRRRSGGRGGGVNV